ncbi:HalOD1 output domain-containing protein [Halorussus sp. AFM4]|uniref:HalOD1 output domain-containing protein n=1 Tax=Halorussus sp. AFM4 TaxID=3421651 RepID=UPI003EB92221
MTTCSFRPKESCSASERIIKLIAEQSDTDPLDLPPLSERIDPAAIDHLFTPDDGEPVFGEINFSYHGHHVSVAYDGEVVVTATPE